MGERGHIGKSCMHPAAAKIAVVIPYYQEEPGILRGAVNSAVVQEGVGDLEIIVVDDGSPAPAHDDLNGLEIPDHVTLKLIEQGNRGPGAARNRALNELSPDTAHVAFLDSDDRWSASHLCNAQYALRRGFDLYFSNAAGYGSILFTGRIDAFEHSQINVSRQLYGFVGHAGPRLMSAFSPVHTSTVVCRWKKFRDIRFPEMFMFGEDVSFWLQIAKRSNRIAFSTLVECLFGKGVHIARDSNWGSPRFIWRTYQAMRWRKWCRNHLSLTLSEKLQNESQIRKLRKQFCLGLLHDLRRFRAFGNPDVLRFFLCDPSVILQVFPVAVDTAFRKAGPSR